MYEPVMTDHTLGVIWKSQTIFYPVLFVPEEIKMNGIVLIKALTQIHYTNPILESQKNFTKNFFIWTATCCLPKRNE